MARLGGSLTDAQKRRNRKTPIGGAAASALKKLGLSDLIDKKERSRTQHDVSAEIRRMRAENRSKAAEAERIKQTMFNKAQGLYSSSAGYNPLTGKEKRGTPRKVAKVAKASPSKAARKAARTGSARENTLTKRQVRSKKIQLNIQAPAYTAAQNAKAARAASKAAFQAKVKKTAAKVAARTGKTGSAAKKAARRLVSSRERGDT